MLKLNKNNSGAKGLTSPLLLPATCQGLQSSTTPHQPPALTPNSILFLLPLLAFQFAELPGTSLPSIWMHSLSLPSLATCPDNHNFLHFSVTTILGDENKLQSSISTDYFFFFHFKQIQNANIFGAILLYHTLSTRSPFVTLLSRRAQSGR